jgi:predicted transcriptional regulator
MSNTFTIRLSDELLAKLREKSRLTGLSIGRIIRDQLDNSEEKTSKQRFLRHLGAIKGGSPNLSARKGFSKE